MEFSFFFSTAVSPAKNSTDCSTLIIMGWYSRPVVASAIVQSVTLNLKKEKEKCLRVEDLDSPHRAPGSWGLPGPRQAAGPRCSHRFRPLQFAALKFRDQSR
jgi:hypothetical protein